MLETSYLEDNLVVFIIFSIVRMSLAFKNLYLNSKFPFAPRFVQLFVAVRLSSPYGEKPDRSSTNQIARLTTIPDREKNILLLCTKLNKIC